MIVYQIDELTVTREGDELHAVLDGVDVSDLHITLGDIMRAGHCVSGSRSWFDSAEVDFKTFAREGVKAPALLVKGDAYAIAVVRKKRDA